MNRKINLMALMAIIVCGSVLTVFVARSQNVNSAVTHDDYRLLTASMNGNLPQVRNLLNGGANPNTPPGPNDRGMTALMFASWGGHAAIVRTLIDKGANVDTATERQTTALMLAANEGHLDCVNALLAAGANPDYSTPDGTTAMMMAAGKGRTQIVRRLSRLGNARGHRLAAGRTPVMLAIITNHMLALETLLDAAEPDLELKDTNGETALMLAAKRGNLAMVEKLLNKRAKLRDRDIRNRTALSKARANNHQAVVQLLVSRGARY